MKAPGRGQKKCAADEPPRNPRDAPTYATMLTECPSEPPRSAVEDWPSEET